MHLIPTEALLARERAVKRRRACYNGAMGIEGLSESSEWYAPPYEMNRVVRIPEAIPELAVEAGDMGVIDSVYEDRILFVEVPKPGGISAGFALIKIGPDGPERVLDYTRLSCWPSEAGEAEHEKESPGARE